MTREEAKELAPVFAAFASATLPIDACIRYQDQKINNHRAKELAPILAAFGNGETIQFRRSDEEWTDCEELHLHHWQLRIKPKDWWVVMFPDGSANAFTNEGEAELHRTNFCPKARIVHLVEQSQD